METFLLMAPPTTQGGKGGTGSMIIGFLPIILIFLIFYFLVLRPQTKRAKDLQRSIAALKQGDRIVTTGGLFGTVVSDKDEGSVFVIKIAENVKVEVAKTAIAGVVKKSKEG
jgi:preprotein translocase subunit YajC